MSQNSTPRIRGLSLFQSSVHGGGSSTRFFSTQEEVIEWVRSPMGAREYERIAQISAGWAWITLERRKRKKRRKSK